MMVFLNTFWQTGLFYGTLMGITWAYEHGWKMGLKYGAFLGFAFGLIMAFVAYYKSRKFTQARPLKPDEKLIEEGPAEYLKKNGWMYLTNARLFFVSDALKKKKHELSIPVSEIVSAENKRSFVVTSDTLILNLKNGTRAELFVQNAKNWVKRIEKTSALLLEASRGLSTYD